MDYTAMLSRNAAALMRLFPDERRHPYYIVTPPYLRLSAGIKVLHTLCHLLNLHGQTAFVTTTSVNCDLLTPSLTRDIVEQHNRAARTPIVIYPEIIAGNPLQAQCVVRYMLNVPGALGGPREFESSEYKVWYSVAYREACKGEGPLLYLPAVDARRFRPPPVNSVRQGSCYYAGKFREWANEEPVGMPEGSIEIHRPSALAQSQEDLIKLFQTCERFYLFEPSSLGLEALLCGCLLIFMPSEYLGELRPSEPFGRAGIAWGDSDSEIEHARRTLPEVPARYERWIQQASAELEEFVTWTQQQARATHYSRIVNLVDPFAPVTYHEQEPRTKGFFRRLPPVLVAASHKLRKMMNRQTVLDD